MALPKEQFERFIVDSRQAIRNGIERQVLKAVDITTDRQGCEARVEQGSNVDDLAALAASGKRFGAILADPPWHFQSWTNGRWKGDGKIFTPAKAPEYHTMSVDQIAAMPVDKLAAKDCVLFCWGIWSMLPEVLCVIAAWGFEYKTCAFNWTKADISQVDPSDYDGAIETQLGLGYWVRQDSEYCLLSTTGNPKRKSTCVRQGIIECRREHSRKPGCVYDRIENLVDGPYLELFARATRPGWTTFGNEASKFGDVRPADSEPSHDAADDIAESIKVAMIR